MTRVLLTGATGFVGARAVQPLLDRGFEVHAVSRRPPADDRGATWHALDLHDAGAVSSTVASVGATHLVHLAWYAEHGLFWRAPENLDWVASSLHLFRAFAAAGGLRTVVAGTCAEYDWSRDCCSPSTPLAPRTLYGTAKDALRRILEAAGEELGIEVAWGRIFFAYGPGEAPTRLVAAASRAFSAGEPLDFSEGSQVRDFLYVDDIASAFAALAASGATGTFDVGSGEGISIADLVRAVERAAGARDLARFGTLPADTGPARIVADPAPLRADAGWQPAIGLAEGLERTVAHWRAGRAG